MEENSDIFLGGDDAVVYSPGPVHKKYSKTFAWSHPFSMYISHDQFFNTSLPCTQRHLFRVTPFCVRDVIDLILSSPISTLLVCHSLLILFHHINSRIDVFVSETHHSLASYIQLTVAYLGRPFR